MAWPALASLDITPILIGVPACAISACIALRRYVRTQVERLEQQARLEMPFQSTNWKALNAYTVEYQRRARYYYAVVTALGALVGGGAGGLALAYLDKIVQ